MGKIQILFNNKIKPLIDSFSYRERKVIYTAGLAGAGKSSILLNDINQSFFVLDPDYFRNFLPQYKILSKTDPENASALTQNDAGMLFSLARNECLKQGVNIVVDGSFSTIHNVKVELAKAKANNYNIEVRALCVSKFEAMQGVFNRFLKNADNQQPSRYVDLEYVQKRYKTIADAMVHVNQQKIDGFSIYNRKKDLLKSPKETKSNNEIKNIFLSSNDLFVKNNSNPFEIINQKYSHIIGNFPKLHNDLMSIQLNFFAFECQKNFSACESIEQILKNDYPDNICYDRELF